MEHSKIPMLAQIYASEQKPIGFDQKDMMKPIEDCTRKAEIELQSVKENVITGP